MAGSQMRLSGINSGFDTEAMIKQMMSAYQTKIDTQNKKLQTLQWKQEQYRDITSKLTSFRNKYFDILKRDTYMMSPSAISKIKASLTTKSGKESGLKVTTSSDAKEGSHTLKVEQLATAATRKGESIASSAFRLDVDGAMKSAAKDEDGNYNFSLDVKVGSVSKTVEFSGADKDSLLSDLNNKLAKSFGASSGSDLFIQAKVNSDGKFGFVTNGNAAVTLTEKTGNFGLAKPAARVAIDPAAALTGTSSISVTFANHYTGNPVTKNIKFATVSSTYFDGRDTDKSVNDAFMNLKKAAYRKANGLAADAEVTDKDMYEAKFRYTSADAAYDLNSQTLTSALNKAFATEQGVRFSIDGSSMTAKFIDGSAVEFTMTSTCDATFGLRKGSVTNSISDNTKLSELGIAQNKVVEPDYTIPDSFKLDVAKAMSKATPGEDGNYSFALDFTVGDKTKSIEFSGSNTNSILVSLNKALKDSFGDSGLRAVNNGDGTLGFKTESTDSITIGENKGNFGLVTMSERVAFNIGDLDKDDTNAHAISFTVNGSDGKPLTTTINFSGLVTPDDFDPNDEWDVTFIRLKEDAYRTANGLSDTDEIDEGDFAAFEYTATDAARDFNLKDKDFIATLNAQMADRGITFEYHQDGFLTAKDAEGNPVKFGVDSNDGNLGRGLGSISHTFANTETTYDGYSMTINGKEISVGKNATISDLIDAVNKSDAGVTMEYSKLESKFIITANDKGAGGQIDIEGGNSLADALGLSGVETVAGQNAKITLDGVEIYHNDNNYELDGIKFDFSDVDPTENDTITINVGKDYSDFKANIKSFVEEYNRMIDEISEYTYTARPMDKKKNYYDPLTDDEKEDMNEKEIEKWETAAKKGLLYHDSTVMTAMSRIRSALTSTVTLENGRKFGLYNMGVKTASLLTSSPTDVRLGKLTLDEDALDKALAENPDAVIKLFTDPDSGVMAKTRNAFDSAVKDSTTSQGSLIRKAGTEKGSSAKTNAIFKEMERINKRIERLQTQYDKKEDYWWKVFTNLEKMQAQFDSQQNYISQFNANGGSLSQ